MSRKPVSLAVGNRRLVKLAAFLEKLPRNRFDYSRFIGADWEGGQNLECGTTACALGWAATMPEFRRLGVRLDTANYAPVIYATGGSIREIDTEVAETIFGVCVTRRLSSCFARTRNCSMNTDTHDEALAKVPQRKRSQNTSDAS